MVINERHKRVIEKDINYKYIGSYEIGDLMLNGKVKTSSKHSYVEVMCLLNNTCYSIRLDCFKDGQRFGNKHNLFNKDGKIYRKCYKCNEILEVCEDNFYKVKNKKFGFDTICIKCESEAGKEYHEKNKEFQNEKRKKRYEKNKEKERAKQKEYYENNSYRFFNYHNNRKLSEEYQGNGINKEQWYDMMEFFNWKCAYSNISLNKDNRSIDHIVPISKFGEHEVWNCVPMLINYNSSKGNKDMFEWYIKQLFYSEERLDKIYEWVEYASNKYK